MAPEVFDAMMASIDVADSSPELEGLAALPRRIASERADVPSDQVGPRGMTWGPSTVASPRYNEWLARHAATSVQAGVCAVYLLLEEIGGEAAWWATTRSTPPR